MRHAKIRWGPDSCPIPRRIDFEMARYNPRMSKIDTIESISDKLAATSISVVPKRCVYIRNWHSRCRSCLTACQHDAVKRSLGHLSIDSELCTNCGACVAACPTSAMSTTAPSATEIVRQARISAERNAGSAAFVCARHAQTTHIDTDRVVVLPCLDYLDEYLITGMFALKFKRVVLFTLSCEGCDIDCEQPYFEEMVRSTHQVLDLWKIPGTFATLDEVPATLVLDKPRAQTNVIKSDRREAFEQAGASAVGYAWHAVSSAIASLTGEAAPDPNAQIIMIPEERFAPDSYRSIRLLRMLETIGTHPQGATIDTRFWASVDIDPDRCKRCGACARMCVTQALKYHVDDERRATLSFRPALCVNCHLCRDSCISHSMIYTTKVPAADLVPDVIEFLYKDEELPQKGSPRIGL